MDLIWLLIISIGGMILLAIGITIGRESSIGDQNTFLFLEAIIVGFFVFLTFSALAVLLFLIKRKEPAVRIRTITEAPTLRQRSEKFQEDRFEFSEN